MTKNRPEKSVHRDEFIALAELGSKEGIFHKYESRVLQNLFFLRDIRTKDIMTPRTVVYALPEDMGAEQLIAESGCMPGLVLNPATPVDLLHWTLEKLDMVANFPPSVALVSFLVMLPFVIFAAAFSMPISVMKLCIQLK